MLTQKAGRGREGDDAVVEDGDIPSKRSPLAFS